MHSQSYPSNSKYKCAVTYRIYEEIPSKVSRARSSCQDHEDTPGESGPGASTTQREAPRASKTCVLSITIGHHAYMTIYYHLVQAGPIHCVRPVFLTSTNGLEPPITGVVGLVIHGGSRVCWARSLLKPGQRSCNSSASECFSYNLQQCQACHHWPSLSRTSTSPCHTPSWHTRQFWPDS